jgi:hypothetical protein
VCVGIADMVEMGRVPRMRLVSDAVGVEMGSLDERRVDRRAGGLALEIVRRVLVVEGRAGMMSVDVRSTVRAGRVAVGRGVFVVLASTVDVAVEVARSWSSSVVVSRTPMMLHASFLVVKLLVALALFILPFDRHLDRP